jgi:hypothetical protein
MPCRQIGSELGKKRSIPSFTEGDHEASDAAKAQACELAAMLEVVGISQEDWGGCNCHGCIAASVSGHTHLGVVV